MDLIHSLVGGFHLAHDALVALDDEVELVILGDYNEMLQLVGRSCWPCRRILTLISL